MKLRTRYLWLVGVAVVGIGSWLALYQLRQSSPFETSNDKGRSPILFPSLRKEPERIATSTTIIAVGDIMTSRNVAAKMRQYGNNYPFASSTAFLSSADITFANLETPITPGSPVPTDSTTFHADPGSETALYSAGIDVVSLANNHTLNYGIKGLTDTWENLDRAQILHTGSGNFLAEAIRPAIVERQSLRFAFLSFNDDDVVPDSYGARVDSGGTALMTIENLQAAMMLAKASADVIIVSMHSGKEYSPSANDRQVAFAHAAIDAGAEVVIGHHPHVVQNIERYNGKYIFYSLGNFVFDQMFSDQTREGLVVKLTFLDKEISSVELHPFKIYDYAQPQPLPLDQAQNIRSRFGIAVSTSTAEVPRFWQIDK